jgi:hypothetical protein
MWRDALIQCLLPTNSTSFRLTQPLGPWHSKPSGWQWFYSEVLNCVYHCTANSITHFPCSSDGHRTRRPQYRLSSRTSSTLPLSAFPTAVVGTPTLLRHTGFLPYIGTPSPTGNDWWGTAIRTPDDFSLLLDGIRQSTAIGVTDGSFKDLFGTAVFTLLPQLCSYDDEVLGKQAKEKKYKYSDACSQAHRHFTPLVFLWMDCEKRKRLLQASGFLDSCLKNGSGPTPR